jgi:hypothetical protein
VLSKILKEFRESEGPIDLLELSRRLDVERSALDGMLETLVQQGKLRVVGPGTEACEHCGGAVSCAHGQASNVMGIAYELVQEVQQ